MVVAFDKIKDSLKDKYDVFMASSSFESRSLSVYNAVKDKITFSYKVVAVSTSNEDQCVNSIKVFTESGFSKIKVSSSDQLLTVESIVNELNSILKTNPNSSFLIDITTFTRQTLIILLRVLRNLLTSNNQIQFVYTPAEEYSLGLPMEDKWLTRGILDVNSVFGYSGKIRPSRPHHLVILMGFEVERASSLIMAYEPTKISVGYAKQKSSISDELYSLNKKRFEELQSEFPGLEAFEFSCTNIGECKADILHQVDKYKEFNIVISPMNNKISTVACALAAFDNDTIQLAIAVPAVYNSENYSKPGNNCHLLEIDNFLKK
jgi:hypothetical protein